jgi:pyrroloquinoline quinone biosynthesis protein A
MKATCVVHPYDTRREEMTMNWIDPAYCDLRLGFEVTAYVYVR